MIFAGKMFSDTAISWINDDNIPLFCFFWSIFIKYPNSFLDDERWDARNDQEWDGMIMDPLSVYPRSNIHLCGWT